jgi:hypothetical protein
MSPRSLVPCTRNDNAEVDAQTPPWASLIVRGCLRIPVTRAVRAMPALAALGRSPVSTPHSTPRTCRADEQPATTWSAGRIAAEPGALVRNAD